MANSSVLNSLTTRSPATRAGNALLSAALPGQHVRIVGIAQDQDVSAWLRAVGLHEEVEMTVLRRAPFGGPMHLRSSDGGEFAINRDLARCIEVAVVPTPLAGNGSIA